MPEVMTCKCGCQEWTIYGIRAECRHCGFEVRMIFGIYQEEGNVYVDVAETNKRIKQHVDA